MSLNNMQNHLLIQELSKLRESSKEAIANGNAPMDDALKNYLHIERPVEKALRQTLLAACAGTEGVLLMVCGNVGDGKSHLLSRLKAQSEMAACLAAFTIHNDATESFSPDEDCIETLTRLLYPFRDDQLGHHPHKILLAINLGTLSNFLEARKADFSRLKSFVETNGIIETAAAAAPPHAGGPFRFVNFTNYHFYSLTAAGPEVSLIGELFRRITSAHDANPVHAAYMQMKSHPWPHPCPVMANFEMLADQASQRVIARLLVACLVKEKQIISFRQLLNFIYDLLVPYQLAQINLTRHQQLLARMNTEERLAALTPYYLFENPQRSKIFYNLYQLDPAIRRYEAFDERTVMLFTEADPFKWLNKHFEGILPFPIHPGPAENIKHEVLTKAYLRFQYFKQPDASEYRDDFFADFMWALYAYNGKDKDGLRPTIELVKKAAYRWNGGTSEKNKAIVPGTIKSTAFRVFRQVQLKTVPPEKGITAAAPALDQFVQELLLEFSSGQERYPIAVDYSLYVLLRNINAGYRPNKIDRQTYVNFGRFVEQVTFAGIGGETLFIDEVNFGQPLDYQFAYNDEYQEFTFSKLHRT